MYICIYIYMYVYIHSIYVYYIVLLIYYVYLISNLHINRWVCHTTHMFAPVTALHCTAPQRRARNGHGQSASATDAFWFVSCPYLITVTYCNPMISQTFAEFYPDSDFDWQHSQWLLKNSWLAVAAHLRKNYQTHILQPPT